MDHVYQTIPGFCDFEDVYAEAVKKAPARAAFVEVGSWLGKSAAYMAVEIANSGKDATFFAVDHWQGSPEIWKYLGEIGQTITDPYSDFLANMRKGGVLDRIVPLCKKSTDAAHCFRDGKLDFVYLDGAHDYENVRADILAWRPKVRPGGTLAGHDFCPNFPGVVRAVRELLPAVRPVGVQSWVYDV